MNKEDEKRHEHYRKAREIREKREIMGLPPDRALTDKEYKKIYGWDRYHREGFNTDVGQSGR